MLVAMTKITQLNKAPFRSMTVFTFLFFTSFSWTVVAAQSAADYKSAFRFNLKGQVTGTIKPGFSYSSEDEYLATRNLYNEQGLLESTETGLLTDWMDESVAPKEWSGFTVYKTVNFTYDDHGRKISEKESANGTTFRLTQYSYDSLSRLECKAERLNLAISLIISACTQGDKSEYGYDRISKFHYDQHGNLLREQRALGTVLLQDYVIYTYDDNHNVESVTDANGNYSELRYDGHSRLKRWVFPSQESAGQLNEDDYEEYEFDNNGNRTKLRKRDGSLISYRYDAQNHLFTKDAPGTSNDVYYKYNNSGLQTVTKFFELTEQAGETSTELKLGIVNVYDGFGRLKSSTNNSSGVAYQLQYQYDKNGNRERITHPDSNYFQYVYDGLNRLTYILKNSISTLVDNRLFHIQYNSQGGARIL